MNFVLQMMNFVSDAVGKWAHKIGLELGEWDFAENDCFSTTNDCFSGCDLYYKNDCFYTENDYFYTEKDCFIPKMTNIVLQMTVYILNNDCFHKTVPSPAGSCWRPVWTWKRYDFGIKLTDLMLNLIDFVLKLIVFLHWQWSFLYWTWYIHAIHRVCTKIDVLFYWNHDRFYPENTCFLGGRVL